MKSNRREFVKLAGLTGLTLAGPGIIPVSGRNDLKEAASLSQQRADASLVPLNRFPRMVHEYYVERVKQIERKGDEIRAAFRTKSDAEKYVLDVREKIQKCFGPWPEKTPLNARVTGILKRNAYNIEKVIFESRPGFPVTANLYVPKKRKFPLPGVIGVCGHTNNGKAGYQNFSLGLVQKGYVVLTFDPIGQGERLQYVDSEYKPLHGIGVREHIYAGTQMFLTGESLYSWFAWDGIRALDYLLTRKEVDPNHIGVTGNSGGGTQTTWLCGVEPRFTMAAPSCFVTTFRRNLENEEVADTEQCPWKALSLGLDHSDFIAAIAPKPVILLSQEKDFFDTRGTAEAFVRLKNLYRLLGAENNIGLFVGPDYHGYSQHNREAMYEWFNKVTKISDVKAEPALTMEKDEDLWCTPHGQVAELKPKTIFSFISLQAHSLKEKRTHPEGNALRKLITETLRIQDHNNAPEFRILRQGPNRNYPKRFAAHYVVETEPGIQIVVYRLNDEALYSRPPVGLKKALLYISHMSADEELRSEPVLAELIRDQQDSAIFACDVRGIGESKPNTTNKAFTDFYGPDYFYATTSNMLDHPYVGQRTYDILKVISFMKSYGHNEIHLVAKGWGAIPATFAAVISENVTRVTLKNALTSYSDIAENEEYTWTISSLIPDILKTFDLPDCYRELAKKNLVNLEPWGAKNT